MKTPKQLSIVTREAPSRTLKPCVVDPEPDEDGVYHWTNDVYSGSLRRFAEGFPLGTGEHVVIGIVAHDQTARHDWREFQQIKNALVGPEWEAVELYPAESRLKDPSNQFYLWCVPPGTLAWGLPRGRLVMPAARAIAPQRPFPGEGGGRRKWSMGPELTAAAMHLESAGDGGDGGRQSRAASSLLALGVAAAAAVNEGGRRGKR